MSGKVGAALEMERARFQANPDDSTYRSVRSVAQLPGQPEECWPELQPQLIQTFEQQGRVVQHLIDGRGRGNYQQAVDHLMRVKQLSQKQERELEWQTYITDLRNKNKSLRALKEELDKKGL